MRDAATCAWRCHDAYFRLRYFRRAFSPPYAYATLLRLVRVHGGDTLLLPFCRVITPLQDTAVAAARHVAAIRRARYCYDIVTRMMRARLISAVILRCFFDTLARCRRRYAAAMLTPLMRCC